MFEGIEIKGGNGNHYTTDFREYDSRLARWFSINPLVHHNLFPYHFANNSPLYFSDRTGLDGEAEVIHEKKTIEVTNTVYYSGEDVKLLSGGNKQKAEDRLKNDYNNQWGDGEHSVTYTNSDGIEET